MTFKIKDLTVQNTGKYKIVISNGKGSSEKVISLAVKEPTPEPSTDLAFINPLKDLSAVDGKTQFLYFMFYRLFRN